MRRRAEPEDSRDGEVRDAVSKLLADARGREVPLPTIVSGLSRKASHDEVCKALSQLVTANRVSYRDDAPASPPGTGGVYFRWLPGKVPVAGSTGATNFRPPLR